MANTATQLPSNATGEAQEKPTKKLAGILSQFWGGGLAKKTNSGDAAANDTSKLVQGITEDTANAAGAGADGVTNESSKLIQDNRSSSAMGQEGESGEKR